MKSLLPFLLLFLLVTGLIYFLNTHNPFTSPFRSTSGTTAAVRQEAGHQRIKVKGLEASAYAQRKGYATHYQFLIDMRLPSSRKRFFVYDAEKDSITGAGLVAHGSCRTRYLEDAQFANVPNSGCSSVGRYKIGYAYAGRFGTAYKLHGLDSTNSQAFARNVVLHAYTCVPDEETGGPICNSLGCPMVSYSFLNRLSTVIRSSPKPVLLWIFD